LKRIFDFFEHEKNKDVKGLIVERCTAALLYTGVTPTQGIMWERLLQVMEDYEHHRFSFKDFLSLIDGFRDEIKILIKTSLQTLFRSYRWSAPPSISAQDVPTFMADMPFCKDCCRNLEALMCVVEACDKDGGGDLDTDSLVNLVVQVSERMRSQQREVEQMVARQLGFSVKQVLQLREAFAAMTTTGFIGVPELRMWFKEINPGMPDPTAREIEDLIDEVSPIHFGGVHSLEIGRRGFGGSNHGSPYSSNLAMSDEDSEENPEDDYSREPSKEEQTLGPLSSVKATELSPGGDRRPTALEKTSEEVHLPGTGENEELEPIDDADSEHVLYFDGYLRLNALIMKA